jgi:hypothetical protein
MAVSHSGQRTTMSYNRARGSLDRHATCIVAAYIASAARQSRRKAAVPPAGARRTAAMPVTAVTKRDQKRIRTAALWRGFDNLVPSL